MGVMTACRNFVRTGAFRRYADGHHLSHRRLQKFGILHDLLEEALPESSGRLADFGCADGAIPVRLLESDLGDRISEYVGVTLFNYTENAAEESYTHPRFRRVVANLEEPIGDALGNPVSETEQVRTRQSWEAMFRDKGWGVDRVFTTQFTGLPFPFTVVDKTDEVATRGSLGANMFFCLRRG